MASKFLASGIGLVVGLALVIFTGGIFAAAGAGLIVSSVFSAAAIALTPDQSEASDKNSSPTYGFTQFRNPVKGDSPVPVIYSTVGHKTAPVWLQAFVTPRGLEEEDAQKFARAQRLSGLLAIAEGPIEDIFDLRFNDEPVFERQIDYALGKGNGTKKKWVLPQSRVVLETVQAAVDGTVYGFLPTRKSALLGVGDGTTKTYSFALPDDILEEIPVNFYNIDPARGSFGSFTLANWELPGFQVWLVEQGRLLVHRDAPLPKGTPIYIAYGARTTNGVTIKKKNEKTEIIFDTPPGSDTKVTASFVRKKIRGLKVEFRRGGAHQIPIWGFQAVRNSFAVQEDMPQGVDVTHTTKSEVDDIALNIASSESGFTKFSKTGSHSSVQAQFALEVRLANPLGTGSTFDKWYRLPDPRGADPSENKNALEFRVTSDSTTQVFWGFSVRNLLDNYAKGFSGNGGAAKKARKAASDFTRAKYEVRVRRTNPVGADNNNRWVDEIGLASVTEIVNESVNLPGTALIGFHALATTRLNGGAPNVTCRAKGKYNVQMVRDVANTLSWVTSPTAQGNRVWAACDLITNWKYGGGEHYDRDVNIDMASALECAEWQDEQVLRGGNSGETEARSRLDIVLDTRRSLMEHLRDILTPGRVWAVLRGDTWFFVKDDAVDLSNVPIIYDDGPPVARTARNSLTFAHDTVVSTPTEVQVQYLREDEEFQGKEVWVVPEEPGDSPRRIRRLTATGTIRQTEASRYGVYVYHQLRTQGASLGVGMTPRALDFGAGDVVRVVSDRVGIDGYWRIFQMDFNTEDFLTRMSGKQYVPENYAQQVDKQRIITDGFSKLMAPPPPIIRTPAAMVPEIAAVGPPPAPRTSELARQAREANRAAKRAQARSRLQGRVRRTA